MRKLLKIAAGMLAGLLLALVILRVVGLDPQGRYPGLWLRGELVTTPVTDWSFVEKDRGLIGIQTREWFLPILAHSVNTGKYVYKGQLYINSAYPAGHQFPYGRHWNRNVMHDPHVRLKIGNKLYDQTLLYIADPVERAEIHKGRKNMNEYSHPGMSSHIFRVMPNDERVTN